MKTSKRIVSFVLSAIMVVTTFFAVGPVFTTEAEAADLPITLGEITQQHVVDNYEEIYKTYQAKFFSGTSADNWPTTMVIPGLGTEDYTPQGMTYWHAKEWILISAYDASSAGGKNSVIYAIDIKSGNFVALFKIFNSDGTINTSHGGGIAASEYNFYYADKGSYISFWPLSEMDVPVNTVKDIYIKGSIDCSGELFGGKQTDKNGSVKDITDSAATSYCCYDDGILWTGNFYHTGDSDKNPQYGNSANSMYNSMVMGYKLYGNSSEQEWHYLASRSIPITITSSNGTWDNGAGTTMPYTITKDNSDGSIDISGTINNTSDSMLGEITLSFASFYLNKGQEYVIEFTSTNNLSDMYMFSPSGNHCNVKQSQTTKITNNGNETYTYSMTFTAGTKPAGADSSWGDGTYTGKYTVRFDQDSVAAGTREFKITDFTIKPKTVEAGADVALTGSNCAGNPTYCIALGTDIDRVQYAMVDKGKLYISRSWSRYESVAHIRELDIADININYPGTKDLTVNGQTRKCHVIKTSDSTFKKFGGTKNESSRNQMLFMGEALCVIDDYLYMFTEGAAYSYRVEESSGNTCPEPIDVIWKIDQYAIAGNPRPIDDVDALRYEKVNSITDIKNGEEYIIVHQSSVRDRVTQKNILYALDSYGGYNGRKMPKSESTNSGDIGDSLGMIGHKITSYTIDGDYLYIDDTDDARKSIRWTLNDVPATTSGGYFNATIRNSDFYYSSSPELYFNERAVMLCTDVDKQTYNTQFFELGDGNFYLLSGGAFFLWCNDGTYPEYIDTYTNYYKNHDRPFTPVYEGLDEVTGTFHTDALLSGVSGTGNKVGRLPESRYHLAYFNIYKRIPDEHTAVGESKVYTDLKAEVQPDGAIDLLMETYATASLHYKTLPTDKQNRPTDYILVLDTSSSMNSEINGYHTSDGWDPMEVYQACGDQTGENWLGQWTFFTNNDNMNKAHGGKYLYRFPDGYFGGIHLAYNNHTVGGNARNLWLWAEHPVNKRCYRISVKGFLTHGNFAGGGDDWESLDDSHRISDADFLANKDAYGWENEAAVLTDVKNGANRTNYHGASNMNSGEKRGTFQILNVTYTDSYGVKRYSYYNDYENSNRIAQMKLVANDLVISIMKQNRENRVGIAQFACGSAQGRVNTGIYKNDGTFKQCPGDFNSFATADYQNTLFYNTQMETALKVISNLSTSSSAYTTYTDYGLYFAKGMLEATQEDYTYNGNRNACIILITDGEPGQDNDANVELAGQVINTSIVAASKVKQTGGSLYTIQIGAQNLNGSNVSAFLSQVSSEYIDTQNSASVGDRNPNTNADYTYDNLVSETEGLTDGFAEKVIATTKNQAKNALAKLDASAIVREKLNTSAFSIEGCQIDAGTVEAYYDGAGRLTFRDAVSTTGIEATNNGNGEFRVTGFDFSKHYVSQTNAATGNSKKLVIRVKDVKMQPDVVHSTTIDTDLVNVAVSEPFPTGVYQNATDMAADSKHKDFPDDRLIIPQYTYVLDYGVDMLDIDINGTLVSVDTVLRKQSTYSTSKEAGKTELEFTNSNQDMIYRIDKDATGMQRYFILIRRPNGEYDWFAINIVPASTVYYEQSIFAVDPNNNTGTAWSAESDGTQAVTNQDISLWDDVYGYDENYLAAGGIYSGGTALKSTVSSSNKRSQTMKTTFNGYGFDLYSVCGPNTGVQIVKVYPTGTTDPMNFKSYVIDTFYNDTNFPGPLYQVPILHHECTYGNYTVEVTSAYLSTAGALQTQSVDSAVIDENGTVSYTGSYAQDREAMILEKLGFEELIGTDVEFIWHSQDSVLNGGKGAQGEDDGAFTTQSTTELVSYIDGIRTYYPGGDNMDAYYKDSEKGATYYNVFDNMKAGVFSGSGISYIYGTSGGQSLNFAEELEKLFEGRPKNEVYLENAGESVITFTVDGLDENSRVMVSLRAAQGSPIAQVNENKFVDGSITKMEMYYDVTDYLGEIVDGKATVIIKNAGNGLLAVDNVKVTGAGGISAQSDLSDVFEILSLDVVEVDPRQPSNSVSSDIGEIPLPPVPDEPDNNDPDDGNDNGNDDITPPSDDNNEDPAEDGFFAKVESFFVKIFNFFKNIFNKVSSFFEF